MFPILECVDFAVAMSPRLGHCTGWEHETRFCCPETCRTAREKCHFVHMCSCCHNWTVTLVHECTTLCMKPVGIQSSYKTFSSLGLLNCSRQKKHKSVFLQFGSLFVISVNCSINAAIFPFPLLDLLKYAVCSSFVIMSADI